MKRELRILHLEDDPEDAELVRTSITGAGLAVEIDLVRDHQGLVDALQKGHYETILSRYHLQGMDARKTLKIMREMAPEIPVVLVTRSLGEETALELLREGATELVLKSRIDWLAPAIERVTAEAEARRERRRIEEELRRAHAETEQILASISSILIGADRNDRVTRWNATAARTFSLPPERVIGQPLGECPVRWDWTAVLGCISNCRRDGRPARHEEIRYMRDDGKEGFLAITVNPINGPDGVYLGFLLLGAEITERRILESQLVQALKLESIGLLAAGIAHEINTPTQYVGDNTRFLRDAFSDLLKVQEKFAQLLEGCRAGSVTPDQIADVGAVLERADIGYLTEEIPKAIQQSLEGLERVTRIVRAMKDFAHPGTGEKTPVDINKAIDSTATVARNEWKYVADLVTDFAPSLPPVPCLPGELNQVFLNVIINAAHAIAAARGDESAPRGVITIQTLRDGDWVEIRVTDTGTGIPEKIRSRVFDPFFTTKGIGKGTGQGLSVSHDVVVKKHGGTITFETEVGKGTTFIIRLPLGAEGHRV